MKKTIKDGWHEICEGTSVYTEDGIILRAVSNGVPAGIYKWDKRLDCRTNVLPIRYDTFRRGFLDDRYAII